MVDVKLSDQILSAAPALRVLAVTADIDNNPTDDVLWSDLQACAEHIRHSGLRIEDVNKQPGIRATRIAYKACGKEPNRYRPSAEALTRRIVKGMDLYRTLTAIDFINLLSLMTGHSIGGFDADKVQGEAVTLGVGCQDEPFEAIGRGQLNIANLPVYRDSVAAIGTPTSDCERTKLTPETSHLLMLVNVYDSDSNADELELLVRNTLARYGAAVTDVRWVHR